MLKNSLVFQENRFELLLEYNKLHIYRNYNCYLALHLFVDILLSYYNSFQLLLDLLLEQYCR